MKYYDISLPLHEGMIVWPGDTKFERKESRGTAITSRLNLSTHTGTHIDAPKHFLFDKSGVDSIALEKFVGKCLVIGIRPASLIQISDLKKFQIKKGDRILLKTRNSQLLARKHFTADYVSLSLEAAQYLSRKKISLIGIDYYGIEAKAAPGHPVHKALLAAGIVIVEGLNLSQVKPGKYLLAALPLKIKSGDGSPARAILWK